MANGKQLAEQNLAVFTAWVTSKSDADFKQIENRGLLSRTEIALQCGFAKSALNQNPRIKEALRLLEDALRLRAVLPTPTSQELAKKAPAEIHHQIAAINNPNEEATLRRLQTENANQKAEIEELRRRLAIYDSLHQALSSTGRVPR
jgi:hypothetical protein